jgi:hypothetical protein
MDAGYTILGMEMVGATRAALRGTVEHVAADGRTETRVYSWPAAITREAVRAAIAALHTQWLATPPLPGAGHPALELVGATDAAAALPVDPAPADAAGGV